MIFNSPQWLILFPIIIGLLAISKRKILTPLSFQNLLRIFIILLITLTLANPHISRKTNNTILWLLVDRSDSIKSITEKNLSEWLDILEKSKSNSKNSINLINFGAEVIQNNNQENQDFNQKFTSKSNIPLAIKHTLSLTNKNENNKILILSDGYSTQKYHPQNTNIKSSKLTQALLKNNIPLYYRLAYKNYSGDSAVASFHAPNKVAIGEPFLITGKITAQHNKNITIYLYKNDTLIFQDKLKSVNGEAIFKANDKLLTQGTFNYSIKIETPNDLINENNTKSTWVSSAGPKKILLITNYKNDPIHQLSNAIGKKITTINTSNQFKKLNISSLSSVKTVIINNVPAHLLPYKFLQHLNFFVTNQGGSFMMIGGKNSFGSGGYYNSPIDDIIPVSMELKTDTHKLPVTFAIVMDRSGSMSMPVHPGLTKMDLANQGTANSIKILGQNDYINVLAVDSSAHTIVPLMQIKNNKSKILNLVSRIESKGGGIFVYNGLNTAWNNIKNSEVSRKHILLFSDASDTEQPGKYKSLCKEIKDNNCSISVIGLGKDTDRDADLLKDIANITDGKIYFSEDPHSIPQIFSQETMSIARSAFIKKDTNTTPSGQWKEISPKNIAWPKTINAYNLSYSKKNTSSALYTTDKYKAPLISFWKKANGKSIAINFPTAGKFSKNILKWKNFPNLIQTSLHWLNNETNIDGLTFFYKKNNNNLDLSLFYRQTKQNNKTNNKTNWEKEFIHKESKIVINSNNIKKEYSWERIKPGLLSTSIKLDDGDTIVGAIQTNKANIPFGPITASTNSEWNFKPKRISELKNIAEISGGSEIVNLASIWSKNKKKSAHSLFYILISTILITIILDAFMSKTNFQKYNFKKPISENITDTKQNKNYRNSIINNKKNISKKLPKIKKNDLKRKERYLKAKKK